MLVVRLIALVCSDQWRVVVVLTLQRLRHQVRLRRVRLKVVVRYSERAQAWLVREYLGRQMWVAQAWVQQLRRTQRVPRHRVLVQHGAGQLVLLAI
jgi:hypothetical protein